MIEEGASPSSSTPFHPIVPFSQPNEINTEQQDLKYLY
jgi:hypothetical protein